ncbi:MAG: calcium/sodium antiporter [Treponema sp.]|nr:calcium/sodium antiporter [Treponema sp.]
MLIINIALMVLGMLLLVKGGDLLVDGASSLARRFNVSELAIGLTIVAFGTSAPELVVSLSATLGSNPEIALGNAIGSSNVNLFVILGITGILAPVAVQRNTIRFEIPFSLFAAVLLLALANFSFLPGNGSRITRIEGVILLLFFGLFIFFVFRGMKNSGTSAGKQPAKTISTAKTVFFIVLGLVFLAAGGEVVVRSAVVLAEALHISKKVIGLTIIAVGTSLPELVTSITAIVKKSEDLALGNIIGSNIFNILLILGVCSTVRPMEYSPVFNRDICLLILGTALLLVAMVTGKKRKLDRWEAAILVLIYIGYAIYMVMRNE